MPENMTDSPQHNIIQVGDWVRVTTSPDVIPYLIGQCGIVTAVSEKDNGAVIQVHGQPLQLFSLDALVPYDINEARALRK